MAQHEQVTVKAQKRDGRGKNDARRARHAGMVPVTIYGGGQASIAAVAPLRELAAILRSDSGFNTVFTMDVEGIGESRVMFQDRQIDGLRGRLLHADFRRLVKGEKVTINVALHLTGEPKGVKEDGGVLDHVAHEIEIRCSPESIPESIEKDVSELGLNEVLHVSDLEAPEGVEILSAPDTVIAIVAMVREEEEAATDEPFAYAAFSRYAKRPPNPPPNPK